MDWIRKQARLYQNLARTMRYQAVVHLEDKEDEYFWDYQLQSVKPGRYRYLYYSKSDKGTDSRGCEQCLRFRPYLTDRFFICIDSDLRLLRGDSHLRPPHLPAQQRPTGRITHACPWGAMVMRVCQKFKHAPTGQKHIAQGTPPWVKVPKQPNALQGQKR